jgi:hypothetical protein
MKLPRMCSCVIAVAVLVFARQGAQAFQPALPDIGGRLLQPTAVIAHPDPLAGKAAINPKTGRLGDPRGRISVKGKELGLSDPEIDQVRNLCGNVGCARSGQRQLGFSGSGCIVGPTGTLLLTARHVLYDDDHRLKGDVCYFHNSSVKNAKTISIDPSATEHLDPGDSDPKVQAYRGDMLLARVKRPVGEPGFPLRREEIDPGESLIFVSSDAITGFDIRGEPTVQKCLVRFVYPFPKRMLPDWDFDHSVTSVLNDCTTTQGASGGVYLINEDGELRAAAVHFGAMASRGTACASRVPGGCVAVALGITPYAMQRLSSMEAHPTGHSHLLGLDLADLTEAYRTRYRIPDGVNGVVVVGIDRANDRGDLSPGDLVVKLNGTPVYDLGTMEAKVAQLRHDSSGAVSLLLRGQAGTTRAVSRPMQ